MTDSPDMRHVGFTGTRDGMTPRQMEVFVKNIREGVFYLHHGDCIGADATAHRLSVSLGVRVVLHPPVDSKYRAWCQGYAEIREPKPYLVRNRDIVDECGFLLATPAGPEELRSGTWATVRYARKIGKPHMVIMPDGTVE